METGGTNESMRLQDAAYRLNRLEEIRCVGGSVWETSCDPGEYVVIVFKDGAGRLQVGQESCWLGNGGYGPKAGATISVNPDHNGRVHGYLVSFSPVGADEPKDAQVQGKPAFLDIGKWSPACYGRLLPVVSRLAAYCGEEAGKIGASLGRGRLLYTLLEELAAEEVERRAAMRDPVLASCDYIDQHFDEDLSRDQLAAMAGLSPWHYSVLFKQATGLSPIEYLTEARIRQAKRLLLRSGNHLRDVARETGFRDEHYFSRRFKMTVGVSPTVYWKKAPERLASLFFACDGDLMELKLMPIASIIDEGATHRSEYFRRIAHPLSAQTLSTRNLTLLRQVNPYLIICTDDPDNRESLGRIAPALSLSYTGLSWRERFMHVAGAVRKEKEAETWLTAYNESVHEARIHIYRSCGMFSCVALALYDDWLIAYRSRNMGELIYRDLQWIDPFGKDSPAFIKRRIDLAELQELNMNCILLHVYSDPHADEWLRRLERDERWQSLRAVRERKVIRIDGSIWREYSAYSHRYMLRELERMMTEA